VIVLKAILHNIGVVLVGLALAWIGTRVDALLGFAPVAFPLSAVLAIVLVALGFLVRLWATIAFYEHRLSVIRLEPQAALVTSGPYRYSRNPLYLGGNVFIFFGAALLAGSPAALVATALHLPLMDLFVRREERQLESEFGPAWRNYKQQVRRWI